MYRIVIVEDDPVIARAVESFLLQQGYDAQALTDFEDVAAQVAASEAQLVLMDISLPCYNGFYWCAQIRAASKAPVLFLSSASDNMSVVLAMNMGGDDFIAKPFDLQVLGAKVRAMLRRAYDFSGPSDALCCGEAILNTNDATLTFRGARAALTRNEYRILKILFERRGSVVSREDIMVRLWESDEFIDENTLTVNIARLRKTLENAGLVDFIKTRKGLGYIIP